SASTIVSFGPSGCWRRKEKNAPVPIAIAARQAIAAIFRLRFARDSTGAAGSLPVSVPRSRLRSEARAEAAGYRSSRSFSSNRAMTRSSSVGSSGFRLMVLRGAPESITTDNGGEFAGKAMETWAYKNGVKLDLIQPGKPVENGYIESFNG